MFFPHRSKFLQHLEPIGGSPRSLFAASSFFKVEPPPRWVVWKDGVVTTWGELLFGPIFRSPGVDFHPCIDETRTLGLGGAIRGFPLRVPRVEGCGPPLWPPQVCNKCGQHGHIARVCTVGVSWDGRNLTHANHDKNMTSCKFMIFSPSHRIFLYCVIHW